MALNLRMSPTQYSAPKRRREQNEDDEQSFLGQREDPYNPNLYPADTRFDGFNKLPYKISSVTRKFARQGLNLAKQHDAALSSLHSLKSSATDKQVPKFVSSARNKRNAATPILHYVNHLNEDLNKKLNQCSEASDLQRLTIIIQAKEAELAELEKIVDKPRRDLDQLLRLSAESVPGGDSSLFQNISQRLSEEHKAALSAYDSFLVETMCSYYVTKEERRQSTVEKSEKHAKAKAKAALAPEHEVLKEVVKQVLAEERRTPNRRQRSSDSQSSHSRGRNSNRSHSRNQTSSGSYNGSNSRSRSRSHSRSHSRSRSQSNGSRQSHQSHQSHQKNKLSRNSKSSNRKHIAFSHQTRGRSKSPRRYNNGRNSSFQHNQKNELRRAAHNRARNRGATPPPPQFFHQNHQRHNNRRQHNDVASFVSKLLQSSRWH